MKYCPNCTFDISDVDGMFCPNCGTKIEMESASIKEQIREKKIDNRCPSCDFDISDVDGKFCPNCGASIVAKAPQPKADKDNKTTNKKLIIFPMIVSLIVILSVVGVFTWKYISDSITVDSISVSSLPDKTSYFVDDELEIQGLTVTAIYKNGSRKTIEEGLSYSTIDQSKVGTQTIEVSYEGFRDSFDIEVKEVEITTVELESLPSKTLYYDGDAVDTEGLSLKVSYNNGKSEVITEGFTYSPKTVSNVGTEQITVKYNDKTVSFDVSVKALSVKSVAVQSKPTKSSYYVGDTLNTSGLVLKVTYNNGSTKTINSGFTYSPTKLSKSGTQSITVTYNNKTTTFNVTVNEVTLSSISIKTNPNKTSYYVGDKLNTKGLTLIATYSNGETQTISSGFTCSPTSLSKSGTQTITVTYSGKTAQFNITATAVTVSSISVLSMPIKTSYYVGESLDTSGLILTTKYSNGATDYIGSGFTCTPTKFTQTGSQKVTVTYGGKTTSFTVTVSSKSSNSGTSNSGSTSSNSVTITGKEDGITLYRWTTSSSSSFYKDYSTCKTDKFSYCISDTSANDLRIIKEYKLQPNTLYVVLADVKTKNVVNKENTTTPLGANISVGDYVNSVGVLGTSDWKTIQVVGKSDSSGYLNVSMNLGYYSNTCTGTAWFENIQIISFDEYYNINNKSSSFNVLEVASSCSYSDSGDIGLNNKGDYVYWEIRITTGTDLSKINAVKCSWTNSATCINGQTSYGQKYSDCGWSSVKSKNTTWESYVYNGYNSVIVGLPDDKSIEGYQYIDINGTKIVFKLTYMGNYSTGTGWLVENVILPK